MQTVKFQCGKCSNLMAVGTELLGKQVRCPHCKEIMLAPVQVPAGPSGLAPVGASTAAARPGEGAMFGGAADTHDGFGAAKRTAELPPAPVNAPEPSAWPSSASSSGIQAAPASGTSANGANASAPPGDQDGSLFSNARELAQARSRQESRGLMFLVMFFLPFSIIMTIVVFALLVFRSKPAEELLIPDRPSDRKTTYQKVGLREDLSERARLGEARRFGAMPFSFH